MSMALLKGGRRRPAWISTTFLGAKIARSHLDPTKKASNTNIGIKKPRGHINPLNRHSERVYSDGNYKSNQQSQ